MTKCDFCSYFNGVTRRCGLYTGSSACVQATERFLYYQKSRISRTSNKNINVKKKYYNKKR